MQASLSPTGSRVGLENFVIRNIPQDRTDGQMALSGTFFLAGLKFEDFDLQANGQLMVMKESSRLAGQKFYGDLFLATGSSGVRWQGQLTNSKVAGDVIIKYSKFFLPPDRETASVAGRTVNVIFRDDTTKLMRKALDEGSQIGRSRKMNSSSQYSSVQPVPRSIMPVSNTLSGLRKCHAPQPSANRFLTISLMI